MSRGRSQSTFFLQLSSIWYLLNGYESVMNAVPRICYFSLQAKLDLFTVEGWLLLLNKLIIR